MDLVSRIFSLVSFQSTAIILRVQIGFLFRQVHYRQFCIFLNRFN